MTPLSVNPSVVIQIIDGKLIAYASNVAPDLNVVVVASDLAFNDEADNKPFNSTLPVQPVQVMSSVASKARHAAKG